MPKHVSEEHWQALEAVLLWKSRMIERHKTEKVNMSNAPLSMKLQLLAQHKKELEPLNICVRAL